MPESLDIREGDILVVKSVDYPIKSAAQWKVSRFASGSFAKLATEQAMTKRSPGIVEGKRGEAAIHLANLYCTPLDPVSPEIQQRSGIQTPHELLQTFISDNTNLVSLVVEDLKR